MIPTKNVAMGIAGIIAFQDGADDAENAKAMEEAAQARAHLHGHICRARQRDRRSENQKERYHRAEQRQGEAKGKDPQVVAKELMRKIVTDDNELITVYYGSDVSETDAQGLTDALADQFGDCDVEMHRGGQPLYYYLISVE